MSHQDTTKPWQDPRPFEHPSLVILPSEPSSEQDYVKEYEQWLAEHPKEVQEGKIPKAMQERYREELAKQLKKG